MNAYADSVKALGTPDLVLYLDVAKTDLQAFVRTKFLTDLGAHLGKEAANDHVVNKVSRPASAAMKTLKGPLAFWLIIAFPDDEMACLALGGQRVGDGSAALS